MGKEKPSQRSRLPSQGKGNKQKKKPPSCMAGEGTLIKKKEPGDVGSEYFSENWEETGVSWIQALLEGLVGNQGKSFGGESERKVSRVTRKKPKNTKGKNLLIGGPHEGPQTKEMGK